MSPPEAPPPGSSRDARVREYHRQEGDEYRSQVGRGSPPGWRSHHAGEVVHGLEGRTTIREHRAPQVHRVQDHADCERDGTHPPNEPVCHGVLLGMSSSLQSFAPCGQRRLSPSRRDTRRLGESPGSYETSRGRSYEHTSSSSRMRATRSGVVRCSCTHRPSVSSPPPMPPPIASSSVESYQ